MACFPFPLQGHFGKVILYMYDPANDGTGELVAVKALKQENGNTEGWIKEIEVLKSLDHCNIVKYKGCCTEGGELLPIILLHQALMKGEKKKNSKFCFPSNHSFLLFLCGHFKTILQVHFSERYSLFSTRIGERSFMSLKDIKRDRDKKK